MSLFIEALAGLLRRPDQGQSVVKHFPNFPDLQVTNSQESDTFFYRQWITPDGRRRIDFSDRCGPEYGDIHMRELSIQFVGDYGGGLIMGVQISTEPNPANTDSRVFLNAIDTDSEVLRLTHVNYTTQLGGFMSPTRGHSHPQPKPNHSNLSAKEFVSACIQELTTSGIRTQDSLPQQIDVDATAQAFVDQILNHQDFYTQPVLIPKPPQLES